MLKPFLIFQLILLTIFSCHVQDEEKTVQIDEFKINGRLVNYDKCADLSRINSFEELQLLRQRIHNEKSNTVLYDEEMVSKAAYIIQTNDTNLVSYEFIYDLKNMKKYYFQTDSDAMPTCPLDFYETKASDINAADMEKLFEKIQAEAMHEENYKYASCSYQIIFADGNFSISSCKYSFEDVANF